MRRSPRCHQSLLCLLTAFSWLALTACEDQPSADQGLGTADAATNTGEAHAGAHSGTNAEDGLAVDMDAAVKQQMAVDSDASVAFDQDASVAFDQDAAVAVGDCFSPTQNVRDAYEPGAEGCECDEEPDVCVQGVALVCSDGQWISVEDGPCWSHSELCANGMVVPSSADCLQDDAFCIPLPDGRFCTGPEAPRCPEGAMPIAKDAECPEYTRCWDQSESLRCAAAAYTPEECESVGGIALSDPGDGSLWAAGCPSGADALGSINADWDEGGLCCPVADGCAPQQYIFIGACEPAPRYYWNGQGCISDIGCTCEGPDCQAGFGSMEACERAYQRCTDSTACGARAGDTCSDDEYCAYIEGDYCGAADAQAICKPKPIACDDNLSKVCGCDGKTYDSPCLAHEAGTGVLEQKPCE